MTARRFPPPWCIDVCFIVRDGFDQALAYVYYEDGPGRRSTAKLLSKHEAWRIAANAGPLAAESIGNVRRVERLVSWPARVVPLSAATAPDRYSSPLSPGSGPQGGALGWPKREHLSL